MTVQRAHHVELLQHGDRAGRSLTSIRGSARSPTWPRATWNGCASAASTTSCTTTAIWTSGRTSFWDDVIAADMIANQYGRTSFLFAGVPGMQMPVSFYTPPTSAVALPIYEQVHNASIFSLYLPIANVADTKRAFHGRNYTDKEFYHTLLMSNHMEADPVQFAEGIRGKVLWHNEYRTQKMYDAFRSAATRSSARGRSPAPSRPQKAAAPYHNNTCDGCHVRNGSGVPINPARQARRGAAGVHVGRRVQPLRSRQGLHVHRADPADEAGVLRPRARHDPPRLVALLRAAVVPGEPASRARRGRCRPRTCTTTTRS